MRSVRFFLLPVWLCIACCNYFFPNLLCIGIAPFGLIEMPSLSCVKAASWKHKNLLVACAIISSLGGLHCATTSQVWEGQTQHNLALSVGLHVLCVEPIFYQLLHLGCTGPTFPYPRAMVRTIIFGKMRIIPPFQRQRRGVGSWAARDTLQKTRLGSYVDIGTPQ